MNLNPEQQAAIEHVEGPCLVIAGAGSGKTRVITHKMVYLIEKRGLKANQIRALTFTNKAARQMKTRIKLLRPDLKGLRISTFHTLGLNILKKEGAYLGLSTGFSLFDAQDSLQLLNMLAEGDLKASPDALKLIQTQISLWKNNHLSPQQILAQATPETQLAARFFVLYEQSLKAYQAVDFDDLIVKPCQLFTEHPERRDFWQDTTRHLLVDEYQDTNEAQYHLVRHLVGPLGRLTAVGDDDQSIYTWRGARPENCHQLQKDYPQLKVIKLEQNYRSTQNILKAANHLIAHNPHLFEKKLWSEKGPGEDIPILAYEHEAEEADQIIQDLLLHRMQRQTAYHDYAILYRSNHQARLFEQGLRQQGIPYYLSGGTSFFSKTEIKDLLAYFRLLLNPQDDTAFLRIINTPRREIGAITLEKLGIYAKSRQLSLFLACFEIGLGQYLDDKSRQRLEHFAQWITLTADNAQRGDPKSVIEAFLEETGYLFFLQETAHTPTQAETKQKNVRDCLNWLYRLIEGQEGKPGLSFDQAIQRMILLDLLDNQEQESPDRLCLSTLHAAKGLEFPFVYLIGLEENNLPHRNSIETDTIEEERRLFYVGITRAMKELKLSYALKRRTQGSFETTTPSRFLSELPSEVIHWPNHPDQTAQKPTLEQTQSRFERLRDLLSESAEG